MDIKLGIYNHIQIYLDFDGDYFWFFKDNVLYQRQKLSSIKKLIDNL